MSPAQEFGAVPTAQTLGQQAGYVPDGLLTLESYIHVGNGSPEGMVAAPVGSLYLRRDGASTSSVYLKEDGDTGNTGWVPSRLVVTPADLITNGGFETDTTGWTTSNCVLARVTSPTPFAGVGAGRMTASSGATMYIETSAVIPVVGGGEYTAFAAFLSAVTSRGVRLDIIWLDAAGATISTSTGTTQTSVTDEWRVAGMIVATAPATAETAKLRCFVESPANGEQHYVDAIYMSRTNPTIYGDLFTAPSPYPRVEITNSSLPFVAFYLGADGETRGLIFQTIGSTGTKTTRILSLSSGKLDSSETEAAMQLSASNSGGDLASFEINNGAGGVIGTFRVRSTNLYHNPAGTDYDILTEQLVDAKGDLLAGTAADAIARLAVGTNNHVLMADSAQSTGLKYLTVGQANLTTGERHLWVSDTAPSSPSEGDLWFEGDTDRLYARGGAAWEVISWNSAAGRVGGQWRRTSDLTVNDSTVTDLTWPTEDIDGGPFLTPTSATLTVPSGMDGLYTALLAGTLSSGQVTTTRCFVDMITTGATWRVPIALANESVFSAAFPVFPLAATNTVKFQFFQVTGGSVTFQGRLDFYRLAR